MSPTPTRPKPTPRTPSPRASPPPAKAREPGQPKQTRSPVSPPPAKTRDARQRRQPDQRVSPRSGQIDPRIRARRVAVLRAAGRRRLRRALILLAVVGVIAAGWGAVRSPLLDVDHLEIVGADETGAEQVMAASGIEPGLAMVDIDVDNVRSQLMALPWVADVSVRRDWPATVQIALTERQASAVVVAPGGFVLMAEDGVVLESAAVPVPGLPVIVIPDGPLEPGTVRVDAGPALIAASLMSPDLAAWIERIVVSATGALTVDLVGSATAELGRPDDPAGALIGLATILGRVELGCIRTIDLTVPDAPVVTRGPGCEVIEVDEDGEPISTPSGASAADEADDGTGDDDADG